MSQSVTFPNRSANIAAVLYVPPNFDAGTKYPAIICGHPISSCTSRPRRSTRRSWQRSAS